MYKSLSLEHISLTNICLAFLLCAVLISLPDTALAGAAKSISDPICKVVKWFTGPVGKAVATLAIIVIGIGALMGKLSWGMALIVVVGIAVIFGSAEIVKELGGKAGGGAC